GDKLLDDDAVAGPTGNYYFDLVPDDYIISIEDPLGRTAVEDTLSPGSQLQNFRTEWTISEEFFVIPERNADLTVATDASGVPIPYTAATGASVEYHVRDINFLLDPGPASPNEVVVSGSVFADFNGDGLFNGDDVAVGTISVFADENQNGQFDGGEPIAQTDSQGQYSLLVDEVFFSQVINIGIQTPIDWTFGQPTDGLNNLLIVPGSVVNDIDFTIVPPAFSSGSGGLIPGYILGSVYGDENESGVRDEDEVGLAGVTVYLDNNNSGTNDFGDTVTTTNANGGYSFSDVPAGSVNVRVDIPGNFDQIVPIANGAFVASVGGGGTVTGLEFAIVDTANFDYGDLPAAYGGVAASASHGKGSFFLGNTIDGELTPQTSPNADGDDTTGFDDEDGITLNELVPGTNTFTANASRNGGYLQTWIDFNGDGDFDDNFGGISERVTVNEALVAGDNTITFQAPDASILGADGPIFARFRYGVFGLDSIGGSTPLGEVEDYMLTVAAPTALPATFANGPDFDGDEMVSLSDLLALQRGYGTQTDATAEMGDADSDGDVDSLDLFQWDVAFGTGQVIVAPPQTDGDFDQDNDVDLSDLLALQRGYGMDDTATLANGDATGDADVEADDLAAWEKDFGLGENASSGGTQGISAASLGFGQAFTASAPPAADAPEPTETVFDTAERTRGELFTFAREFANRFDLPARPIDRAEDAVADFRERLEDRPVLQNLKSIDLDQVSREDIVDALHGLRDRFRSTLDDLREEIGGKGEALDDAFADFGV
ncbi:MAG: SdrD B-like domain-containing protein, partial [Planctomycetota bacterium]